MAIEKIVSGGQTGVDRAALDFALSKGLSCGGWCPKGRLAEDGPLERRYPLLETPSSNHSQRTEWNVRDSDGTLILHQGPLTGGTALTLRLALAYGKPHFLVDLGRDPVPDPACWWLQEEDILVLNVAGPREEGRSNIQSVALEFLQRLFNRCEQPSSQG